MKDERAKRAAESVVEWYGAILAMLIDEQKAVERTASVIAAEYADVLAENERLRKRVAELECLIRDAKPFLHNNWPSNLVLLDRIDAAIAKEANT